jgi:hypothetical protein
VFKDSSARIACTAHHSSRREKSLLLFATSLAHNQFQITSSLLFPVFIQKMWFLHFIVAIVLAVSVNVNADANVNPWRRVRAQDNTPNVPILHPDYTYSIVAGNDQSSLRGPPSSAPFNSPSSVWGDVYGNLFVVDNKNYVIRQVNYQCSVDPTAPPTTSVSTIAGSGDSHMLRSGEDGIEPTSANLNKPNGVWGDILGNIFIADTKNTIIRMISKATGKVSTYAGDAGKKGNNDGKALNGASFTSPFSGFTDENLVTYVVDDEACTIRQIQPDSTGVNMVTTIAGIAKQCHSTDISGSATTTTINNPTGIWRSTTGVIYFTENDGKRIKTLSNGILSTLLGFGGGLDKPSGIWGDNLGNIVFSESQNPRINMFTVDTDTTSPPAVTVIAEGLDQSDIGGIWMNAVDGSIFVTDSHYQVLIRLSRTNRPTYGVSSTANLNIPTGFCLPTDVAYQQAPVGGALEILTANKDINGYQTVYVNRQANKPGLKTLSSTEFDSWIAPLPADTTARQLSPPLPPTPSGSPTPSLTTGPFVKNVGERNLVMKGVCYWKSPDKAYTSPTFPNVPCASSALSTGCIEVVTYNNPQGVSIAPLKYAWINIAKTTCGFVYPNAVIPFNPSGVAPDNNVVVSVANKCSSYKYIAGTTRVYLMDPWGNKYIMHAYADGFDVASTDLSVIKLPQGWIAARETLVATDFLNSFVWPDPATPTQPHPYCLSVVLRDNLGNGYHQATWNTKISINDAYSCDNYFSVAAFSNQCASAVTSTYLNGFSTSSV